jgi:hypothetical protein
MLLAPLLEAQSSGVLDDLEQRAIAALDKSPHATTGAEVDRQRGLLRRRLEGSLKVGLIGQIDPATALLYLPKSSDVPAPAVVILRPHEDPMSAESQVFAASLARLGFVVVSLDLRAHHNRLDLLLSGVTPQGLLQNDVRAALQLLLTRSDVNKKRIGLAASGLTATIAAALNPQFSVVDIMDGSPDLRERIKRFRVLGGNDAPDPCELIPGLLSYAATEDLFTMIAPRPVLIANLAGVYS